MIPLFTTTDRVRLGSGFRAVMPPAARARFGMAEGSELVVEIDEFGVHLFTLEQAARRSAALLAQWIAPERVLSEELLVDRRREAALGRDD